MYDEKSSDVEGPVRHAAHRHVERLGELLFQHIPSCGDVAGPENRSVFLASGISGAGEVQDSAVRIRLSLVFKNTPGVGESIEICPVRAEEFLMLAADKKKPLPGFPLIFPVPVRTGKRFCRVTPPGIKAAGEKFPAALLPVQLPGLFVKSVIGRQVIEKEACVGHLTIIFCSVIHIRPYGHHGVDMEFVNPVDCRPDIRIACFVQNLASPVICRPGLPVLHDAVKSDADVAIFLSDLNEFILRGILFPGLDISEGPLREHCRLPRQPAESIDEFIRRIPGDKVIVQLFHSVAEEIGATLIVVKGHEASAVREDTVASVRDQERNRDAHVVLVEVLGVASVVVDALFPLTKPVDLFSGLESERELRPIRSVVLNLPQVFNKISFSVYGFHSADDWLLSAG